MQVSDAAECSWSSSACVQRCFSVYDAGVHTLSATRSVHGGVELIVTGATV